MFALSELLPVEQFSEPPPAEQFFGLDKRPADRFFDTDRQRAEQFFGLDKRPVGLSFVRSQHFQPNQPMIPTTLKMRAQSTKKYD